MTPSSLYEIITEATIGLLAGISVVVVAGLRWALQGWKSLGAKTVAVHLLNLPILLATIPVVSGFAVMIAYSAITRLGVILLWAAFLAADGVRVWRQAQWRPGASRLAPWAYLAVICALGVSLARVTAQSGVGIQALSNVRDYATVTQTMERSPFGREVLPVMRRAFPADLRQITLSYLRQVRAASAARTKIENFPLSEFDGFLWSKRAAFAYAPDPQLRDVAKAMASAGDQLTDAACAAGVAAPNAPAPTGVQEKLGQLMAVELVAERAGMDHPASRPWSPTRATALLERFEDSLPQSLRAAARRGVRASPLETCELGGALMRWLGGLPDDDAAYFMSLQPQSPGWPRGARAT